MQAVADDHLDGGAVHAGGQVAEAERPVGDDYGQDGSPAGVTMLAFAPR